MTRTTQTNYILISILPLNARAFESCTDLHKSRGTAAATRAAAGVGVRRKWKEGFEQPWRDMRETKQGDYATFSRVIFDILPKYIVKDIVVYIISHM